MPVPNGAASNGPTAELSSLASSLEELTGRIRRLAEDSAGTEHDAVAQGLFEVERKLGEALRRLTRVSDTR